MKSDLDQIAVDDMQHDLCDMLPCHQCAETVACDTCGQQTANTFRCDDCVILAKAKMLRGY